MLVGQTFGEIYGEISVEGQTVGFRRNSGRRTDGRISGKFRLEDRRSNFGETLKMSENLGEIREFRAKGRRSEDFGETWRIIGESRRNSGVDG